MTITLLCPSPSFSLPNHIKTSGASIRFFPEARSDELVDIGKRMICFKCIHKEGMFDPIFKTVFRILFLSPTS